MTLKTEITIILSTVDGKVISSNELTKTLSPLSSECVFGADIKSNKKEIFLSVKMYENDTLISERTKIFVPDRDMKLKANTINTTVSYENGEIVVKMKSPVFCRSVMVDIEDFREPFSDNYFDLLPNEEKVVKVKADKEYKVTVKSLADIPVKGSKLKTNLFRAKFFVEPENLANWFYYTVN